VQFEEPISLAAIARDAWERGRVARADETWGGEADRAAAPPSPVAGHLRRGEARAGPGVANRIAYGISRAVTITPIGLVAAALLSHVRRDCPPPR